MEDPTNPKKLSKKAKEVSAEVKETASEVVDQTQSAVQIAWQEAKNNVTAVETYTKEHPIRAVLLAFGMGVVLGTFVRR
jgi:ElaB/YqjD/DUF883 family membrane-anchored ribosome-binding protein